MSGQINNHSHGFGEDCEPENCSAHPDNLRIQSKPKVTPFGKAVAERLRKSADLFEERNAVYKDNYSVVGRVMEALFPDGHTQLEQDDHNRWHLFELLIVKLTRYAANFDTGGHSDSSSDSRVYWAMLEQLDHELAQTEEKGYDLSVGLGAPSRATFEGKRITIPDAITVTIPSDGDLKPHVTVSYGKTEEHKEALVRHYDGEVFVEGDTVYLKQHLGNAKPLFINMIDFSQSSGLVIAVNSDVGGDVTWVHPTWINHRPMTLQEQMHGWGGTGD